MACLHPIQQRSWEKIGLADVLFCLKCNKELDRHPLNPAEFTRGDASMRTMSATDILRKHGEQVGKAIANKKVETKKVEAKKVEAKKVEAEKPAVAAAVIPPRIVYSRLEGVGEVLKKHKGAHIEIAALVKESDELYAKHGGRKNEREQEMDVKRSIKLLAAMGLYKEEKGKLIRL